VKKIESLRPTKLISKDKTKKKNMKDKNPSSLY
jgi:hypothetical protein